MIHSVLLFGLFTFLGHPLLATAFHNITYNSNDTALVYYPSGEWMDWRPEGCLSWPIGQWTRNAAGQIALNFEGVAVYAYGIFDDAVSNPIYTITVDGEDPVRLGDFPVPSDRKCDPLFSKTGLDHTKNHTILFKMTNERPDDVKDLSFQGFIVTVADQGDIPDEGDNAAGSKNSGKRSIIIGAIVGVVVIVAIVIATIIFRRIRRKRQAAASQIQPAFVNPNQFVSPYQPMPSTPGVGGPPPPAPFILPQSHGSTPQQNQPPANWLPQGQAGPWNSQTQQQVPMQLQYPSQPQHQQYQIPPSWSPAPSDGQSYPSPVTTPFSGQNQGTYPSTSPSPPNEGYNQYAYSAPSNAPPHTFPNQQPGTQNDVLVSQVATQVMQQSYSGNNQEIDSKQSPYGQAGGSSGSATAAGIPAQKDSKGGIDPNAAPVVRNQNKEIEATGTGGRADAPPPGYMP